MNVKVLTPPTSEVLTANEVINFILPGNTSDTIGSAELSLINDMITASREVVERQYNLALAAQTLVVNIYPEDLNYSKIQLPRYPQKGYVAADFTVKAVDYEGTETDLVLNEGYYLYGEANYIEIEFTNRTATVGLNTSWNLYKVEYIAGYGITNYTEIMPKAIKQAMVMMVSDWYKNRDNWVPVIAENSKVDMALRPFSKKLWI